MKGYQFLAVAFSVLFINVTQANTCSYFLSKNSNPKSLTISADALRNESMPFLEHIGLPDDRFGTSLAMNIQYPPIVSLREQITQQLGLSTPLKFFTGFNKNGEAHVTTVTPVEYHDKLRRFVSPEKMSEIAMRFNIQSSDLEILGLGCGQAVLSGKNEDTYFVIIRSENLLRIRRAIYEEYLRNGGIPSEWNPEHFFPHITIGYTLRDLHEDDGVFKDLVHSLDARFRLYLVNSI